MCNCIEEAENRLKELVNKNEGWKDREITSVDLENKCILLSGGGVRLYSPVKIEYDYFNRKGEKKHKKQNVNLSYKYCPFCGKKYEEGEEN